ncbi:MAG: hypothetical protein ACPG3U_05390 [Rhodothermales bacterium]
MFSGTLIHLPGSDYHGDIRLISSGQTSNQHANDCSRDCLSEKIHFNLSQPRYPQRLKSAKIEF